MYGKWNENTGISFINDNGLKVYMYKYGISDVLVYHSIAKYNCVITGNSLLVKELGKIEGIHICWTLLPSSMEGFTDIFTIKRAFAANQVRAVRLFPKLHEYLFKRWIVDDMLGMLNEINMPVILDFNNRLWHEQPDWDDIYSVCSGFPKIPFILTRCSIASDKYLYSILSKLPNIYVETSFYQVNRGIEKLVKQFSAKRLLFGTGAPVFNPGCPITMLELADISSEDKTRIRRLNMEELIKGVKCIV